MNKQIAFLSTLAPAKINLGLSIGSPHPNGLHPLRGHMISVNWYDRLYLSKRNDQQQNCVYRCAMQKFHPKPIDDLCVRAISLLHAELGLQSHELAGFDLTVIKSIPIAAGLGGGSADAAAVLRLLFAYWNIELTAERLHALCLALGSDVPFAYSQLPARITQYGECLQHDQEILSRFDFALICYPHIELSTKMMYACFDELSQQAITSKYILSEHEIANDFLQVIRCKFPALYAFYLRLGKLAVDHGCEYSLSGSGPSMYILIKKHAEASKIMNNLLKLSVQEKRFRVRCKLVQSLAVRQQVQERL